jgi:hypothetical protein
MADDETCSSCSLAFDEDPGGTAARQRHWLLIEQPGAWGPNALLESKLPEEVARTISARARRAKIRVLLIRRDAAPPEEGASRIWRFVTATVEDPVMGGGTFVDPHDLLHVDIVGMAEGTVPVPGEGDEPLVAVCTHGRHDRCCADRGRPVARALRTAGVDAWECSHVGGDRFAANMVSFPHGLYHGRVTPETAPDVVAAYREGRIHPDGFRGRTTWSPASQKAEALLRRELDEWRVDAVTLGPHAIDDRRHVIEMAVDGRGTYEVVVDIGRDGRPRVLSCGGSPQEPRTISLVEIRPR